MRKSNPLTKYIKIRMAQEGLGTKELAKLIDMDTRYVSTLINNGTENIPFFVRISNYLDVTVETLINKCYEN